MTAKHVLRLHAPFLCLSCSAGLPSPACAPVPRALPGSHHRRWHYCCWVLAVAKTAAEAAAVQSGAPGAADHWMAAAAAGGGPVAAVQLPGAPAQCHHCWLRRLAKEMGRQVACWQAAPRGHPLPPRARPARPPPLSDRWVWGWWRAGTSWIACATPADGQTSDPTNVKRFRQLPSRGCEAPVKLDKCENNRHPHLCPHLYHDRGLLTAKT